MSIFDKFAPQAKAFTGDPQGVHLNGIPTTYSNPRSGSIVDAPADISFVYEIQSSILRYAVPVPTKVFDLQSDGEREEARNHRAGELLRKPNPRHNADEFREFIYASRLNFGEHFICKVRDRRGEVVQLWPLRPDRLKEVPDPDTGELLGFMLNYESANPMAIDINDLIWGTSWHPTNDYRGLSPISAMRYQIELGRDAEKTAVDLFANGAFLRGALKVDKKAGVESLRRLAKQFRDMLIGSGNRYRIPVLEDGVEFVPLQLTPADSEFINTSNLTRARVAAAFGWALPEEWTSTQAPDIRRLRFQDAVVPLCSAVAASYESDFMPEFGGQAFVEFQLAHILEADFPELIGALKEAVYAGIYTINDARRKLNLPPVAGGDVSLVPLNLSVVTELTPNPRPSDSGGGMGGDEGRTESTASAPVAEPKALADATEAKASPERYAQMRAKRTAKLTEALGNRVRGILKRELNDIRAAKASLPLASDLENIVRSRDAEMHKLIGQFLTQSAIAGAEDAGYLTGTEAIDPDRFSALFDQRAERVANQFGTDRGSWLIDLLAQAQSGDMDQRTFMNAVADGYGERFSHYGERIARTEVAYAHEAAARAMWEDSGATGMVWNFGGGPCTTGVCTDLDGTVIAMGAQFDGIEAIDGPPAHNSCTCFSTPSFGVSA